MSGVTDADRDKVVEIIRQSLADEKWLPPRPYKLHIYRLAAALAEEREQGYARGYAEGVDDGIASVHQ